MKKICNAKILTQIKKSLILSKSDLDKIIVNFHSEMAKGLAGTKSSLAMIPSFVEMPTGQETGKFIALDLGGTNFRVLEVVLKGKGKVRVISDSKFKLRNQDITGTGRQLFDFIADSIKGFIYTKKIRDDERRSLGFTFSFPLDQRNIAEGILLCWNKGFSASGVIGKNVVALLDAAFKRKKISNIKTTALVNDTVGTLVSKAYTDRECNLGLILGTGTNACYPEKTARITKQRGLKTASGDMIINIEWGNFNKLSRTVYDEQLDKATNNSKRQRLEKMVSGMYLGEVVRLILLDLIKRKILFKGNNCDVFAVPNKFKTEYISVIDSDSSRDLVKVKTILIQLGVLHSTYSDRIKIKNICRLVKMRSAYISTAAMTAVILWMDPKLGKKHTVAIDGSLFEKSPHYRKYMRLAFRELLNKKADKIKLTLSKDGSGKGAAVTAAIAAKQSTCTVHQVE